MERSDQIDPTGILEGHAPGEAYTPEHGEQELLGRLQSRFNEAEQARLNWERDSNFFLLYLQGNQLILRSSTDDTVLRATVISDQSRELHSIDNVLRPTERAFSGKLSRIIPSVTVLPASEDQSDMAAAQVAESFLDFQFRVQRMRAKYVQACRQLSWAGTSVFQLAWNRDGGQEIAWCKACHYTGEREDVGRVCPSCQATAEAEADQENQKRQASMQQMQQQSQVIGMPPPQAPPMAEPEPSPKLERAKNGDLNVILHDPRDFFPEPGIDEICEMRWCVIRRALPVTELRRLFPQVEESIEAEDQIYTDRTLGFYGTAYDSRGDAQYLRDHAYLYEYHEKPTAMYPRGRLIYVANDRIMDIRDSPYYELGRLPFYVWRCDKVDGDFWGETWMSQAWHLQKERNQLLTQIRSQRELTLYPQRLIPLNARISLSEWDRMPGRNILYNSMGGKPQFMEIPPFPAYVYNELERMHGAIREKPGVTDQEVGRSTGDPSGRYAAILEAQSSESIAPIIVENNLEWLELHRGMLILAQRYYAPERVFTIRGRERVRTFAWSEMNLNPGWDVELYEEDSLSKNPALRLQQAERLLSAGVFNDPTKGNLPDMRLFKKVAGLKLPGVGPDLDGAERVYASSVPDLIAHNAYEGPMPWDDAAIMAEELLGWLRTQGRTAPRSLLEQVYKVWEVYMRTLGEVVPPLGEAQGQGQGQQQRPQPKQPSGMGAGAEPQQPPVMQASEEIHQADQGAEALAQAAPHEG